MILCIRMIWTVSSVSSMWIWERWYRQKNPRFNISLDAFPPQASRTNLSLWSGWRSGSTIQLPQKKSTTHSFCVLTANCIQIRWQSPREFPSKLLSSSTSATAEGQDWTVSQTQGVVSSQTTSFCKTENVLILSLQYLHRWSFANDQFTVVKKSEDHQTLCCIHRLFYPARLTVSKCF